MNLRQRQEQYESSQDSLIIRRVPVIIRAEIRNVKRLTQNLDKPFSSKFNDLVAQSMLFAAVDIQDAVFGFCTGAEINFILRNDRQLDAEPWNGNNQQRISSTVSSLLTAGFYRYLKLFYDGDIGLLGHVIFCTKTYAVPYIAEAVNYLIWRQQVCGKMALNEALTYELARNGFEDKMEISSLVNNTTDEDKITALEKHCGVRFSDYDTMFSRGVALYKIPMAADEETGLRNKWLLNSVVPDFVSDRDFVQSIITNGSDVIRAEYI